MLTITRSWNLNQDLLIKNINSQNLTQSSLHITVLITLYLNKTQLYLLQDFTIINLIKLFIINLRVYILIRNVRLPHIINRQLCLQCACFLTISFSQKNIKYNLIKNISLYFTNMFIMGPYLNE